MARTGSLACLSKQTITNSLECVISCMIFVGIIYLILLVLGLSQLTKIDTLIQTLGYISIVIIISAPIGLYGSAKSKYWALFFYYLLASYHLYALVMYIWFNIRTSELIPKETSDSTNARLFSGLSLHQVTTGAYTVLVCLSLILVILKIISTTNQIEPAKVIVVDNNPLD